MSARSSATGRIRPSSERCPCGRRNTRCRTMARRRGLSWQAACFMPSKDVNRAASTHRQSSASSPQGSRGLPLPLIWGVHSFAGWPVCSKHASIGAWKIRPKELAKPEAGVTTAGWCSAPRCLSRLSSTQSSLRLRAGPQLAEARAHLTFHESPLPARVATVEEMVMNSS
jgi:hypothetical protein